MSNDRGVVVASLIWVGVLVAVSRRWVGDIHAAIVTATHGVQLAKTPGGAGKSGLGNDSGGAGGGGGGGGGGSW